MAKEQALLKAARRALQDGAYERAAVILRTLEQDLPHGALAKDRAWLAYQVAQRREAAKRER